MTMMDNTFNTRLKAAKNQEERRTILLNMRLSALSPDLLMILNIAAIPHWFTDHLLETLSDNDTYNLYYQLLQLNFVEQVPGKGYAIQGRTRRQILASLWRNNEDMFREVSGRAASYCAKQKEATGSAEWQAEEIYHRLVCDPEAGVAGLRGLATGWANYEYNTYEVIEYTIRLAREHIEAGRLTGQAATWTRLWQTKLALISGQTGQIQPPLTEIIPEPDSDPLLAAEVAQTRGDWLAKSGDRDGMEAAWRWAYNLYQQVEGGRLDAYLVSEKLRQAGFSPPQQEPSTKSGPPRQLNRAAKQLIDNIEAAWIDGVLNKALDKTLDLRMVRDSDQPATIVFHRPQGLDRPLVGNHHLSRLFEAAGGSLLILGAPGSGKTITLLQLLEEQLKEARQDGRVPIPLLFNLSSFSAFAQDKKLEEIDLGYWLAEQAYNQYRLKHKTTLKQLNEGRFVLLLDGLDEVSAENDLRERCVKAINDFIQESPCGLVVCSRIGDYQSLKNRLELAQSLVLQPLSNHQIEVFINQVQSEDRPALHQAIQADWQLREALRSPLVLNLFPQAFKSMPPGGFQAASQSHSIEGRRQALFSAYVDTIFDKPASTNHHENEKEAANSKEKNIHWLTFLASQMQQRAMSLFYIEDLQTSWLPPKSLGSYRRTYGFYIGFVNGLISVATALLIYTLSLSLRNFSLFIIIIPSIALPIFGTLVGILMGLGSGLTAWLTTRIRPASLRALIGMVCNIYLILPGWILSNTLASLPTKIQLWERVRPARPTTRRLFRFVVRGSLTGLTVGILFSAFIWSLIFGPYDPDLLYVIGVSGIVFLIMGTFAGGFLAFLNTPTVDQRPKPGSGDRATLRNGIIMTILSGILFGGVTLIADLRFSQDNIDSFLFSMVPSNILPLAFTWFGGLAFFQRRALLRLLHQQGSIPKHLIPWLNEMVTRGLLRRAGGGYIFIHRSLLEYFAALEETSES